MWARFLVDVGKVIFKISKNSPSQSISSVEFYMISLFWVLRHMKSLLAK